MIIICVLLGYIAYDANRIEDAPQAVQPAPAKVKTAGGPPKPVLKAITTPEKAPGPGPADHFLTNPAANLKSTTMWEWRHAPLENRLATSMAFLGLEFTIHHLPMPTDEEMAAMGKDFEAAITNTDLDGAEDNQAASNMSAGVWMKMHPELYASKPSQPEPMVEFKGDRLGVTLQKFEKAHARTINGKELGFKLYPQSTTITIVRMQESELKSDIHLDYLSESKKAALNKAMFYGTYSEDLRYQDSIANVPADVAYYFIQPSTIKPNPQLFLIDIHFESANFTAVLESLTAKYGKPSQSGSQAVRSRMGAKFADETYAWQVFGFEIRLEKYDESLNVSHLMFQYPELMDEYVSRTKGMGVQQGLRDL